MQWLSVPVVMEILSSCQPTLWAVTALLLCNATAKVLTLPTHVSRRFTRLVFLYTATSSLNWRWCPNLFVMTDASGFQRNWKMPKHCKLVNLNRQRLRKKTVIITWNVAIRHSATWFLVTLLPVRLKNVAIKDMAWTTQVLLFILTSQRLSVVWVKMW